MPLTTKIPSRTASRIADCLAVGLARLVTGVGRAALLAGFAGTLVILAAGAAGAQVDLPVGGDVLQLSARQQRKEGQVFIADGDVDIHYGEKRMRADHVEYNGTTNMVLARGHVEFDFETQQLNGDEADYNVKTGRGHFVHVKGLLHVMHEANTSVFVTPNPLYFEAASVERLDESTYRIYNAKVTVCDPTRPTWTFNTSQATLHVDKKLALLNANFRIFRIPLLYFPYATLPASQKLRQSGFLMPELGRSSVKGYELGDSYYWAPREWADATLGAEWLSLRGWSETADFRAKPWENVTMSGSYFGVVDKGVPNAAGILIPQGGHTLGLKFDAQLRGGWHAAADINYLSSLTFQLVFSPTFNEAVNSEVTSTGFLTNNFKGYSINFAANDYKDYLNAATGTTPETSIVLRNSPEVRFDSVDRSPWKSLPVYFGWDVYSDAFQRSDPEIHTPQFVNRSEFAPRVTIPLHWKSWLSVTPSYSYMATRYGAQENGNAIVEQPVWRTVGEFSVDLRPPTIERVWVRPHSKWKHTIEPEIVYTYATGVNDFARFIRLDQDDTITDTNEVQYGITQRLYRKNSAGEIKELASWSLLQKYYFDPTFGGALVPGQSNIIQALDSVTPFGFADGPVRISPLVSDLKITPGGIYDAEVRLEYDPVRRRITTAETLLKMQPYKNFNLSAAEYSVDASSVLQPISDQVRVMAGYGALNKRGWGAEVGLSFDLNQNSAQNELVQVNYNGSCCGLAFGYQRLSLGTIRNENQFRVSFIIANIGAIGNLRPQDKIF